jgi:hypothetical protein
MLPYRGLSVGMLVQRKTRVFGCCLPASCIERAVYLMLHAAGGTIYCSGWVTPLTRCHSS